MNIMRPLLFLFTIIFGAQCWLSPIQAQSFDEALSLYQQQKYEEAAKMFTTLNSDEATLFTGKSYFGMGQYLRAQTFLTQIDSTAQRDIYLDARYTAALTYFQLKNFDKALAIFYELTQTDTAQISARANQFYNEILGYLTIQQRKEAFQRVENPAIKFDLIKSAFKKVDYKSAKVLLQQFKSSIADTLFNNNIAELEQMVADSVTYEMEMTFANHVDAPTGITYNIGAALPEYTTDENEFGISQGLYFGFLMAADEFNRQKSFKKAYIRFKNTAANPDSISHIMTDFAWNYQIDAILGPLFSEPANIMASLAEEYQIPMLAPLANSDSLNSDNPYVFQANPTFVEHGKKMAEFAVKDLQMDTLAVLAERGSLGSISAYAFREEAEKLGAKIAYFFVEDLKSRGYEITEFSKHFTTDITLIDSLGYHYLDGVYAPFTGQVAPTLIDLLLIDLEGLDSDLTVLGSQEWGASAINEDRLGDRTIYFTESYYKNSKSDKIDEFNERFEDRFAMEPNRFALIGYDAARFLLNTLDRVENPALLKNALKNQPLYQGLISNIKFDGTHINQEVKIFKLSEQGIFPARY